MVYWPSLSTQNRLSIANKLNNILTILIKRNFQIKVVKCAGWSLGHNSGMAKETYGAFANGI